ncbi:hypothetical protein Micbo1qcDRAFT_234783, partial [Microdochium bolleyi]
LQTSQDVQCLVHFLLHPSLLFIAGRRHVTFVLFTVLCLGNILCTIWPADITFFRFNQRAIVRLQEPVSSIDPFTFKPLSPDTHPSRKSRTFHHEGLHLHPASVGLCHYNHHDPGVPDISPHPPRTGRRHQRRPSSDAASPQLRRWRERERDGSLRGRSELDLCYSGRPQCNKA